MWDVVIGGLVTIITGIAGYEWKRARDYRRELKEVQEETRREQKIYNEMIIQSITCLTRSNLLDIHSKYKKRGSISIPGRENWDKLYNSYRALGGNGMMVQLNNEVCELPTEEVGG